MAKMLGKIPISVKILTMAIGMLGLLIAVIYISYNRLRKVNAEIENLAESIVPITNFVAKADRIALEQELQLERVFTLYESDIPKTQQIEAEIDKFKRQEKQLDRELTAATNLLNAELHSTSAAVREKVDLLKPRLAQIEREHQDFHDRASVAFALLEAGKKEEAYRLEEELETEKDQFDREIANILFDLERLTVKAAKAAQRHQQWVLHLGLCVTAIATGLGLVSASVITVGMVRPTRRLLLSMKAIREGDLNVRIDCTSNDEIGLLATSFNQMAIELKQKEQIKETFGKYLDPRVVERLMSHPDGANTQGQKQVMTVFFSDIEGFGDLGKTLTPDELVRLTNQYLSLMSAPISENYGVIDKFIGTIVMGFWGQPFTGEADHAKLACDAALDQIARLERLRRAIADTVKSAIAPSKLDIRIGLATGSLVVGNVGSESSKSYTVIGDTVNIASRLKGASQQYGVRALMSEETQQQVVEVMETRELDCIKVVGKEEPIRVYELLSRKGELDPTRTQLREAFERGLSCYRHRHWESALSQFDICLQLDVRDRPSQLYLQRVQQFREHPPADDWDGVWRLTRK